MCVGVKMESQLCGVETHAATSNQIYFIDELSNEEGHLPSTIYYLSIHVDVLPMSCVCVRRVVNGKTFPCIIGISTKCQKVNIVVIDFDIFSPI